MGRRIPKSRKHKKLKFVDPSYKGDLPQPKKGRKSTNEPPRAVDEQEVSGRVKEFINLKNKAKQNKLKRKRKKKKAMKDDFIIVNNRIVEDEPGMERKARKLPSEVRQNKNESQYKFFDRLQKMVNTAIAEAKVEEKYNIQLLDVDDQGNAQYVVADAAASERKKEKRKKHKEKQLEKKRLRNDNAQFDLKKEKVQFGEVVSAPPIFNAKPRKAPQLNKPGKRDLALKSMIPPSVAKSSLDPSVAPLSKKWKDMPLQKREAMERERLRAVQMYRIMKSKKAS